MTTSVAKNTLYLTIASIGQKVLAFVYFIYLARVMQPEATGVYFLAISISTMFTVVADFGITPVVVREVAKKPEDALNLVRRALGTKLPFFVLAIIGANTAAWLLGYDMLIRQLVALLSVVLVLDSTHLLFYGILRGHQSLQFESLGVFVGMSFTVLFGGTVLLMDPQLILLVVALLIGSTFNVLFSAKHVVRLLGAKALVPIWDWAKTKALLMIALPFFLAGVFNRIYSYVDSILLSQYIGTEAVGIYSIPYKITYAFQFLPMAFIAALYPGMSALVGKDPKALARLFNDAMWYMAIIMSPIVFGIWAITPDVVMLAGEGYTQAAPVLAALIFVLVPIFLDFPIGALLNAADRQVTKTAVMGGTMVINVIANVVLIPQVGILGAAYAALLSFTFMLFADLWFVPKMIPSYKFRSLIRTTGPILVSGIVMGLIASWLRPVIGFVLVIPVAAVIYGAMLVLTRSIRKTHLQEAWRLFRKKPAVYATPSAHDN